MKKYLSIIVVSLFVLSSGIAFAYDGSLIDDTSYTGTITKIDRGARVIELTTKFEKTPKTWKLNMQDECQIQVMTTKDPSERGAFKKFAELKEGTLVNVYGWPKDGKWLARKISILNPDDYMVKRLEADAKAGVFFGHEP
ncbi:MAG: hypothetical protein HZA00_04770 [Nitrospinae bacterium]|nr:hypothetical protein [Nitrospinota bacterium]